MGVWPVTKVNPPQHCTAGLGELDVWPTKSLLERQGDYRCRSAQKQFVPVGDDYGDHASTCKYR